MNCANSRSALILAFAIELACCLALGSGGCRREAKREALQQPALAAPTPQPSATSRSSLFKALLIGVGDYREDFGWLRIPAEDDVVHLAAALSDAGYEVETLTTRTGPLDRGTILTRINSFLDRATQFHTIVVYVSAHGVIKPVARFIPSNCRLSDVTTCGVSLEDVHGAVRGSAPKNKLLLIDSCYSGQVAGEAPQTAFDFRGTAAGMAVFSASRHNEVASILGQRSLFTKQVVSALRDRQLLAEDGHLPLKRFATRVAQAVNVEAETELQRRQNPTLSPVEADDFPLVEAPQGQRREQCIAVASPRFEFEPLENEALFSMYSQDRFLELTLGDNTRRLPFVPLTTPGIIYAENAVVMREAARSEFHAEPGLSERTSELWECFGKCAHAVNNIKLKLFDVRPTESPSRALTIEYGSASYADYVGTNLSIDFVDLSHSRRRLRADLEPGPKLRPLATSGCANHLGISALVTTSDAKLVFERSLDTVMTYPNMLAPSVSASCNLNDCGPPSGLFHAIVREAAEELGLTQTEIVDLRMIGMARELRRGGKPEAYFHVFTNLSFGELLERAQAHLKAHARDRPTPTAPNKSWSIGEITAYPALVGVAEHGLFRIGNPAELETLFDTPDVAPPSLAAVAFYIRWAQRLPETPP